MRPRFRREGRAAAALVALAALAGCAGSPPPSDAFHRLAVPPPPARATPILPGTVEVDRFDAADALRARPLAVLDADGALRHARYDLWVDGPPVLLQRALVAWLRAGGVADRVVTPERRADPAWSVSGRIERFERVAGADGDAASVALELALRDERGRTVPVQGVYRATRRADDASAAAAVRALGAAVGEAFSAFLTDVEAADLPR